jgi:hypothetical protein
MKTFRFTTLNHAFQHFSAAFTCAVVMAALLFAPAVRAQDAGTLSSLLGQLTSASQSSSDSVLKSLGGELATKAQVLGASLAGNADVQSQLTTALQSLVGNKGPEAVAVFQKLSAAKLTPDQIGLAKQFGQVGSAYLVQKNLGALEGSQSDVAQIVSSLRSGNVTAALPAIKKVSQNVNLTPAQKDLMTSVANKFMPGAGAISNGLKSLPGF